MDAADIAIRALEAELARAQRSLETAQSNTRICTERVHRLSAAITDIRLALMPPPPPPPPPTPNAERLLFPPRRSFPALVLAALTAHDRPDGLNSTQVASLIGGGVHRQAVNVELCHMAERGMVSRVGHGRYRLVQQEAAVQ